MNIKSLSKSLFLLLIAFNSTLALSQITTYTYSGTADTYTVGPGVSIIQIEASGGQGGDGAGGTGGLGATMIGTFNVTEGDVLDIVVGGAGEMFSNSGGGGAGSGVIFAGNPLVVAGGGGGAASTSDGYGGEISEAGGSSSGPGGIGGNGGQKGYWSGDCGWAAGGGGFIGDGYGGNADWDGGGLPGVLAGEGGGISWLNGGAGGIDGGCAFDSNAGAWGCGGGGAGEFGGAGGGGYSGGGGGQYVDGDALNHGGGGGGSFNDGINQINSEGAHTGNGEIIITIICGPETIDLVATMTDEIFGDDGSIDLAVFGDYGPFTFDWNTDELDDFDDDEDLTDLVSGSYTVVVRDSNGCKTTETFIVDSQVGIKELASDFGKVYPNPANDIVTIDVNGPFTIELLTIDGELLFKDSGEDQIQIPLNSISKETYLLSIHSKDQVNTVKLQKQ